MVSEPSVTRESRIQEALDRMPLARKVALISGGDTWSTPADPAIGLGRIVFSDGPNGVRGELWDERVPSLCLPSQSALAATWDETLVGRVAGLLASEAKRKGVHVLLGPTINLHRSPLGGRHFECFSEDPLLTSRLAAAYVRGLQSHGVGSCPKHYVANDSETDRLFLDVRVDERTLRELYLAPFEAAVEAGAWAVMAAYNGLNGVTMTEHPLLRDPLKNEWGFDGLVVSDWSAVRSTVPSAEAGTDLAMPGPCEAWGKKLTDAVLSGGVPEAAIDDKVRRLLRLADRVGVLNRTETQTPDRRAIASEAPLLREAAAAGMVLLRNERGLLPLREERLHRVAVVGQPAVSPVIQGGGSAAVAPPYTVSPLQGLGEGLRDDIAVAHHPGVALDEGLIPAPSDLLLNPETKARGLHVRLLDGLGCVVRIEDRESSGLVWLPNVLRGVEAIEVRTRLLAARDGTHYLGVGGFGRSRMPGLYQLHLDGRLLLEETVPPPDSWELVPWNRSTPAAAEVELRAGQEVDLVVTHRGWPPEFGAFVSLVVREPMVSDAEAIATAAAQARAADVAVVVVGTTAQIETEGSDRSTLALPGRQVELIEAVAEANPNTVVAVNAGAPVELDWADKVSAVLLSWFPGQEFGHALADVLLGRCEPGGRLPTTWAMRQTDVPVLDVQPREGRLNYNEGTHIGYRAWAGTPAQPAYPFGHGLGYTTWMYEAIDAPARLAAGEVAKVCVVVRNTGARPGREVVQLYLQRRDSSVDRPPLWLAGFGSGIAEPGESIEIEMDIAPRAFQHWCVQNGRWSTELGSFSFLAGPSAATLPLHRTIEISAAR